MTGAPERWRARADALVGASLIVAPALAFAAVWLDALRTRDAAWRASLVSHAWWVPVGLAGAALFAVGPWIADGASRGALAAGGVALLGATAIVTRGYTPGGFRDAGHGSLLGVGAITAAALVCAYALTTAGITLTRVSGWAIHPNTWAAHLAAGHVAALIVLGARRRFGAQLVVALLGCASIATTGSRTALAAIVIGSVAALIIDSGRIRGSAGRRRLRVLLASAAIALVVAATALLVPSGVRFMVSGAAPVNLVITSEDLTSSFWTARDVEVTRLDARMPAVHRLDATASDGLARLHQRHLLQPAEAVTLSLEFGPEADHAGVLAFGDDGGRLEVARDGTLRRAPTTPRVLSIHSDDLEGGWSRLVVTLRHEGATPLVWRLGIAPTLHAGTGASVLVRRPQLARGEHDQVYVGTTLADLERGRAAVSAGNRLGYVTAAWQVAGERWLFGHGRSDHFGDLVAEVAPDRLAAADRPSHAHSLVLDLFVAQGAVGVAGFTALALAWAGALPPHARRRTLPFVLTCIVSNIGDATLLTGGPEFAAFALLLWWHGEGRPPAGRPGAPGAGGHAEASPRPGSVSFDRGVSSSRVS